METEEKEGWSREREKATEREQPVFYVRQTERETERERKEEKKNKKKIKARLFFKVTELVYIPISDVSCSSLPYICQLFVFSVFFITILVIRRGMLMWF